MATLSTCRLFQPSAISSFKHKQRITPTFQPRADDTVLRYFRLILPFPSYCPPHLLLRSAAPSYFACVPRPAHDSTAQAAQHSPAVHSRTSSASSAMYFRRLPICFGPTLYHLSLSLSLPFSAPFSLPLLCSALPASVEVPAC